MAVSFRNAFYIKLGKAGKWEADSIKHRRLRIGWDEIPLKLIRAEAWNEIRRRVKDHKALRRICESSSEDVWITFHKHQLWWCRLGAPKVKEDGTSKYRQLKGKWHNRNSKGDALTLDQIPGSIAKIQAYRAPCCRVKERETLQRLLSGEPSEAYKSLERALSRTEKAVVAAVRTLHWKDFETLVDLLFLSRTGWRRRSVLGETMKGIDMELEDTLTRDVYQVQVKSKASLKDFRSFCEGRIAGVRCYFVVHSPSENLGVGGPVQKDVQLIGPKELAALVVSSGLVSWLATRVRYSGSI